MTSLKRFQHTLMDLTVTDGQVHCLDGRPFDRVAYSRFKYGWLPPAIAYGQGLAALIADQLWEFAGDRPINIVSAPYKFVPTASHAIAQHLLYDLSLRAMRVGLEPPVLVPFHKAKVGDSTYAQGDQSDRKAITKTLGLHIDQSLIPRSVVLVVDDIRITGTAQDATADHLEPLAPYSVWYLHAARLSPEVGLANPGLEDELNQTVPHTIESILGDVAAGEFQLNTRVLRHILELHPDDLLRFLSAMPLSLLREIQQATVGSGQEYQQRHQYALMLVNEMLAKRLRSTVSRLQPAYR